MKELIIYCTIAAAGYVLGDRMRKKGQNFKQLGLCQNLALYAMVILMGLRMGSKEEVIDNLSTIGLTSFVITIFALVFSVIFLSITRRFLGIDRYAHMKEFDDSRGAASDNSGEQAEEEKEPFYKSLTFRITAGVVAGMALGYFLIRPVFAGSMDTVDYIITWTIRIGLSTMLVFVGIEMGLSGTVFANLKKVGARIFVLPVAVVLGTFFGVGICSLFFDLTLRQCLAVGAGFGWYTLAPGIIMEKGFITVGAISFLHNVMRETFGIILIPFVAKHVGYVECTGLAGSSCMDMCMLIAERATNAEAAVCSFVIGVGLNLLIPIAVPLLI